VSGTASADARAVLEFLAEHRFAIVPQVQVLLDCSTRVARQQLRSLLSAGHVRSDRIFTGRPSTCRITPSGLRAIGSPLAPPRVHLSAYDHDLGLGWLWLAARDGSFGALTAIHSERFMRSDDARSDRSGRAFGVGTGVLGPRGREQLHYPDLLLHTRAGRRVAVELELTAKSRPRLAGIMLGYASDARLDAVLYLVGDGRLAARTERAARDAGIASLVQVQPLAGQPHGGPDHGRAPARRRRLHVAEAAR
jgi:hypothetical protein